MRAALERLRASLGARKDVLRALVADRALRLQAKKTQLQENSTASALDKAEQRLRSLHGSIFTMAEFVRARESETNYRGLAQQIGSMVDQVNTNCINAMAAAGVY